MAALENRKIIRLHTNATLATTMRISFHRVLFAISLIFGISSGHADASGAFRFEEKQSLQEMTGYLIKRFPLQSSRNDLRRTFVEQGRATLIVHPSEAGVEKYIFDINLCSLYIWRWNISADYDTKGELAQLYLNGNPLFSEGKAKRIVPKTAAVGKKSSIYKAQRPRPEAIKGESSLAYILFDRDSDPITTSDQLLIGSGPSRADPSNFGKMTVYSEVDPWRSIFDSDRANKS